MADLLIDTGVFIDHLCGATVLEPGRRRLHYSVVTRAEPFAGNAATNLSKEARSGPIHGSRSGHAST